MLSKKYEQKILMKRLIMLLITGSLFIAAFVLNIIMNQPLYNVNLNQVPIWQNDPFWGSNSFLTYMNVISNIFNPLVCAGYILLFYLISYRKLEILVFLIWFIFLSWILSLLKMIFHQARPYWVFQSGIQMLQWTCYTQYGMPSGHSMMALILMEFIVRFYARINKCVSKFIWIFYIIIAFFQICVMFSRVILGMHSLNQVLIGCLIGIFSFIPYYLFIQKLILKWIISIFRQQKSGFILFMLFCTAVTALAIQILIALLINYNNFTYITVINTFSGCDGYKIYKSFQYKCLQDSALIMAAIGILTAFNFIKNPSHLTLQLSYSKISWKFLGRFLITIIIPLIILAIFLNPLWQKIQVDDQDMALIIWACQVIGFFFSVFFLIFIVPIVNEKLGFQQYQYPQSYQMFKQYQSSTLNTSETISFRISQIRTQRRKQTQLSQTQKSIQYRMRNKQINSLEI